MNIKNAKEMKENVSKIIKNRTKCTKNNKLSTEKDVKFIKKCKKLSKKQQAQIKKFNKFLTKFIIIEYVLASAMLLVLNNIQLIKQIRQQNQIIESQEQTISVLTQTNKIMLNINSTKKLINYTSVEEKSVKTDSRKYLGRFKITHYCACTKCCGKNAKGITASGKKVEENKTIAVDPKVIKLGSKVYIDGYGLMEAQDTGSAIKGNIIDVYIPDHNEALKLGVTYKDVYIVE